jgi:hypothetical protein
MENQLVVNPGTMPNQGLAILELAAENLGQAIVWTVVVASDYGLDGNVLQGYATREEAVSRAERSRIAMARECWVEARIVAPVSVRA